MADTLLRLKVDSKEYDDKLKRATEGIQRYVQKCREVGGTLEHLDDGVLDFVKGLGEMDTVAKTGTQQLREMTKSITDLTIQYRSLTDEEKQSPFGQAMAASLQQLTERAATVRDAIGDVNSAINRAASDTRIFDQIAGAAGLTTAAFQTLQGASKLLGVDLGDNVEVIAKLQAAMAVTNGLTQIQTALQKESALMQGVAAVQTQANAAAQALLAKNTATATAASKAFNAVANANPYVLIGTALAAATTALIVFTRHNKDAAEAVKSNEEAIKRAERVTNAYKNSMSSTYADLMSKYDGLKRAWVALADTQQKTEWINDNRKAFQDLGVSINSISEAEDVFEKNTAAVVSGFKRRAEAAAIAARMVDMYKQKIEMEQRASEIASQHRAIAYHTRVYPGEGSRFTPDAQPDQYGRTTYNEGRYTRNGNAFVFTSKGADEYNKTLADTVPELKKLKAEYQDNNQQIEKWSNRLSQLEQEMRPTTGNGIATSKQYPSGSLPDLTQRLQELKTAQAQARNNSDWVKYQQQIEQVQYQIDALKGTWKEGLQATFTINADDTEALAKLGEIQGATIADKTVMVTAHNAEALAQLAEIQGVTIADKTVTVQADDTEALAKLGEIEGVTIADKTVMVTAHNAEALARLAEIQGVTIADKTVTVQADTAEAYNQIISLTKNIDGSTVSFNVVPKTDRAIGRSITNSAGLKDFIASIKKELQDADFGSDLYQSLTGKLADATMLENLIKESLSVGLGTALFDIADETGQDFWDRVLSPDGVENADWQAIADAINRKRKEMGLDAITLDFTTGNVATKAQTTANTDLLDTAKKLVGGLSQVSSGLENMGIKLSDEANQFLTSVQGVINVIEGLKTVAEVITGSTASSIVAVGTSVVQALFANTSALFANTAATTAAATAEAGEVVMDAFKTVAVAAMAHGGVVPHAASGYAVPGRHYSGDVTPIMANAGEVVLNRAQQGNLVSQLQELDRESNTPSRPYVTGQDIYLGLNNYLIGAGKGEIITTKNIKSYIN